MNEKERENEGDRNRERYKKIISLKILKECTKSSERYNEGENDKEIR
jgi:hypothetical protein